MKSKITTRTITTVGALTALIWVMYLSGIGFIPTPWGLKITIMHLPVIIGAILEGPFVGAFLGLMFGITSMLQNMGGPFGPIFLDPMVSVVPRICIGLVAYLCYRYFPERPRAFRVGLAAAFATFTNTAGVLGTIYFFHAKQYIESKHIDPTTLKAVLWGVVATNSIPEIIAAVIITVAVVLSVQTALRDKK
ncbi:MAG: ECF transporter S component [Hyphomonadaceae bacterium]|nr:ECF transporter S component [Clostridia bacterium]